MAITQEMFREWMKINHPDRMKFNPTLISVDWADDSLNFGMRKHYGTLVMTIPDTLKIYEELNLEALSHEKRRLEEFFEGNLINITDVKLDLYNLIKKRISGLKLRNEMTSHIVYDLQAEDYGYYYDKNEKLKKM